MRQILPPNCKTLRIRGGSPRWSREELFVIPEADPQDTPLQCLYGAREGPELGWKGHEHGQVPLFLLLLPTILNPEPSYSVPAGPSGSETGALWPHGTQCWPCQV